MPDQISTHLLQFIIINYSIMASKFDLKFQRQESQFKIQEVSKKKTSALNKNHRYSVISYEKRVQLIKLASSKGYSISRAARELGIKPSTGKFIVKCYRDNGKIMKKSHSQQVKSSLNNQECSVGQTGDQKTLENQKRIQINENVDFGGSEELRQDMQAYAAPIAESPIFILGYPYEQGMLNQMVFYQNLQNLSGMMMPIFFTQASQY